MGKINIDNRLNDLANWLLFKKEMCETCVGSCCFMPVEVKIPDLIRLNILADFFLDASSQKQLQEQLQEQMQEQIKEAKKHPAIKRYTRSTGKFTLTQKPNGACFYLTKDAQCSMYNQRPETCRNHPRIGPKPNFCAYIKKD